LSLIGVLPKKTTLTQVTPCTSGKREMFLMAEKVKTTTELKARDPKKTTLTQVTPCTSGKREMFLMAEKVKTTTELEARDY